MAETWEDWEEDERQRKAESKVFDYEINYAERYYSFVVIEGEKNQSDEQEKIVLYTNTWEEVDSLEIAKRCFYIGNPKIVREYGFEAHFSELTNAEKFAYAHWRDWHIVTKESLAESALPYEPDPHEHTVLAEISTDI